jgi:hypothetical protein
MNQSKLLTVSELKRDYHFSHTGTYRAINAGHIEAVKLGRGTFIIRDSVERYLASLPRVGQKIAS